MGKVSQCFDAGGDPVKLNKADCLEVGFEWVVPPNNYDNIFASMLTFFEISTLEMWPDIMFNAFDQAPEVDGIMEKDANPIIAVLYISFIFITTLLFHLSVDVPLVVEDACVKQKFLFCIL